MSEQLRRTTPGSDRAASRTPSEPTDGPAPVAPAVEVAAGIGPGFPGWWLRLALGVVSAAAVVLNLQVEVGAGVMTVLGFLLVGLAVGTVIAPQTIAPTLLILGVMTAHLLSRDEGIQLISGVLAVLLLAVHQLAGVCAAIPPRSIVHRAALRPALLRFVLCAGVVLVAVVVATLT